MSEKLEKEQISIGALKDFSLEQIISGIDSTGVLRLTYGTAYASLIFVDGNIIQLRENQKDLAINQLSKFGGWKQGEFIFLQWDAEFSFDPQFLDEVLFLSAVTNASLKISCEVGDVNAELHIQDGIICQALLGKKCGSSATKKIVQIRNSVFHAKVGAQTHGDLQLDYNSVRWLFTLVKVKEEVESDEKIIETENNKQAKTIKEMNVNKLKTAVSNVKEQLGDDLIACDVWLTGDGQSIAGHNSQPKAAALFERLTGQLKTALSTADFPGLGNYYLIKMEDDSMAVIILLEEYQWGLLLGPNVQMGLVLNIILPQAIKDFVDALEG